MFVDPVSFRTDLVARILNVGIDALQMLKRLSQCRHVRQMKRHVINRFRRRLSFEKRDRDIVVTNRHSVSEIEFFAQSQSALEPLRAFLRIASQPDQSDQLLQA